MSDANEPTKSRREEYSEATRDALIAAGRDLILERGYGQTRIEAIARAARVTRGAFYYHFKDKTALFDAVVVQLQVDAMARITRQARAEPDPWRQLRTGLDAYLDACTEPAYRQIVIQDAPGVLGDARYREIDEANALGLLIAELAALKQAALIQSADVDLLGRMIAAAVCEVALLLSTAERPDKLKQSASDAIGRMLEGFRRT